MRFNSFAIETPTNPGTCYWAYPKTFELQGSNDLMNWERIFSETNSNRFSARAVLTWVKLNKTYKYSAIRFIATLSDRPTSQFAISRFDILGPFSVKDLNGCFCSFCKKNVFLERNLLLMMFFVCA